MKMKVIYGSCGVRKPTRLLIGGAFVALSFSISSAFGGNVGEAELAPGKSATCFSAPCSVTFRVPDGEDTYEIRQGPLTEPSLEITQLVRR